MWQAIPDDIPLETILADPQAEIKLLASIWKAQAMLFNLLVSQLEPAMFMSRRVTIAPGGTFTYDTQIKPARWEISVSPTIPAANVQIEIHYGEFPALSVLDILQAGDYASFTATNSRLLLRNAGTVSATVTIVGASGGNGGLFRP